MTAAYFRLVPGVERFKDRPVVKVDESDRGVRLLIDDVDDGVEFNREFWFSGDASVWRSSDDRFETLEYLIPQRCIVEALRIDTPPSFDPLARLWRTAAPTWMPNQRQFVLKDVEGGIVVVQAKGLQELRKVGRRRHSRNEDRTISDLSRPAVAADILRTTSWRRRFLPSSVVGPTRILGADLRGARLDGILFDRVTFRECRFDRATLAFAAFGGCSIEDCSFDGADFSDTLLGANGRRCEYRSVTFRGSEMHLVEIGNAMFENCIVQPRSGLTTRFRNVPIRGTAFAGDVSGAVFSDTRPTRKKPLLSEVDFQAARFRDLGFLGVDMSAVTLPKDAVRRTRPEVFGAFFRRWPVGLEETAGPLVI